MNLKEDYRILIVGNYVPEIADKIRSELTQKLLRTKTLTLGYSKNCVLLQPINPSPMGALIGRVAKSLGWKTVLFAPDPDLNQAIDLIIKVSVNCKAFGEDRAEQATSELEACMLPYEGIDKVFELSLTANADRTAHRVVPQRNLIAKPPPLTNAPFTDVTTFRDKVSKEIPDTLDRNVKPTHPGVCNDTSRAGGLQST